MSEDIIAGSGVKRCHVVEAAGAGMVLGVGGGPTSGIALGQAARLPQ